MYVPKAVLGGAQTRLARAAHNPTETCVNPKYTGLSPLSRGIYGVGSISLDQVTSFPQPLKFKPRREIMAMFIIIDISGASQVH
jgi:hypothetical protein